MIKQYIRQLKTNGNSIGEYIDIVFCTIKYGASPNNYKDFNFKNLTKEERATYVTNGYSRKIIKKSNDSQYIGIFEDKRKFADKFKNYFQRDWIDTENMNYEQFCSFLEGKDKIIYKPIDNAQGKGIIVFDDLNNCKKIFDIISMKKENAILEEWIQQHEVMSKIYADAINCLRIITFLGKKDVYFLAGGVTWGNGKKIANASASGIVSPVNFSTGILEKPAADFSGNLYSKHPITAENLVGIKLPYWEEIKSMLKRAAKEIPQVAYVGWDIAITPQGPLLIEGNTTPGYRYYQIPEHMEKHMGNRNKYEWCFKEG